MRLRFSWAMFAEARFPFPPFIRVAVERNGKIASQCKRSR